MNLSASLSGWVDPVIPKRDGIVLDLLLLLSLILYVVGFLAVRRVTTHAFALLVLLAVIHIVSHRQGIKALLGESGTTFLICALSTPFLAGLFAMMLRGKVELSDLDGPSRFLFAGLALLYFQDKRVRFAGLFASAAPAALLLALLAALAHPEVVSRWGGRFATPSVDPNTLGSYAVILSFMTLLSLGARDGANRWLRVLGYTGLAAGALLATLAASRGGWLAVGPLLILWLVLRAKHGLLPIARQLLTILGIVVAGMILIPSVADRALGAGNEVRFWLDGTNTETPAGQRLSIYKLAGTLIAERPLTGYGSKGVADHLSLPESAALASPVIRDIFVKGGPHNDFLGLLLGFGLFGGVAFVLLVFGPMFFFWRHRNAGGEVRLAAELGVCLTVGVFICGLTNEMLSLKYLASFYGLTVAALAGQVLSAPSSTVTTP